MSRPHAHLFHSADLGSQLEAQRREISTAIHQLSPNQLTAENQAQVETHYIEKNSITPLLLHSENVVLEDPPEVPYKVRSEFGGYRTGKYREFRFLTPFSGEAVLFGFRPSQSTLSPPQGTVEGSNLIFTLNSDGNPQTDIKREFEHFVTSVQQYIGWQRPMLDDWNATLPTFVKKQVQARRDKLVADRQLVDGLGFRVVRRGENPVAVTVPIQRKQVIPPLPPARPGVVATPDPALDVAIYEEILNTLDSMSLVMERTPSAFAKMDEETLRMQFLVPLNANFVGMASGETFNHVGKTDILIKHQDRILFIAECKFWKGPQSLTDAISQLLSYTTWRETKAAILLFSRNKDFTSVLSQVSQVVSQHPQYVRREDYAKPTGFRFIARSPNDPQRHLTVTVLAFNVPVEN